MMYFSPASLDRGLARGVGSQDIQAEAEQLQGDVGSQQLPGLDHHVHAQDGQQEQAVELTGVFQELLHVVDRGEHDEDADAQEEHLEEQGVIVNRQQAVVQGLVLAPQHEQRQDDDAS